MRVVLVRVPVEGKKGETKEIRAGFHQWIDRAEIVPPSIMKGGHGGGVARATFALCEDEEGIMFEAYPGAVKFEVPFNVMADKKEDDANV